jgi:PHP family Zn ribbon phosphoesterase
VTVSGVRAALEQSLKQKRNADAVVEVVTAEDIGKMPDKNVADAIQRLPGVNIQSSAGGEGGFGETTASACAAPAHRCSKPCSTATPSRPATGSC